MNLIATVLKFGDRTQIGAVHLATSLVASLQLIAAAVVWTYAANVLTDGVLTVEQTAAVVSLSGGALFANVVSVVLLVVETVSFQRAKEVVVARSPLPQLGPHLSSAGLFLVLRRMRLPLIVLIIIFSVSVLGLSLIPGEDAQGRPDRMGLFDAFYVMSYTATTIGFGELPHGSPPRSGCGSRSRSSCPSPAGPTPSARCSR